MPPKPMAPIASVIQMRPFRSAPSSRSGSDRPAASRGANSAHSSDRDQRQHRHEAKTRAPADRLADQIGQGHADDRGRGQAEHHLADRLRTAVLRNERGRDQRGDAEIGAMRQSRQKSSRDHPAEARRERGERVAEREHRHQGQQLGAPGEPRAKHGDQRRAQHHAERVGADRVPRGRLVDPEVGSEERQQAHRCEFGGSDRKATHREREQDDGEVRGR